MLYTIHDYAAMLGDEHRMKAFSEALRRATKPGSVVVDLGTGMGYFAVLACHLGAKHVYAIETNPAISVGEKLARENKVADRITWYQEDSHKVTLPEPADVLISDLRGLLPHCEGLLPAIIDARQRFLKPDGCLLPQTDRIWVTIGSDSEAYTQAISPWNPVSLDPVTPRIYSEALTNAYVSSDLTTATVLAEPQLWQEINYRKATTLDHRQTVSFTVNQTAQAHGFFLWFDCQVDAISSYAYGPKIPTPIYGCAFFPWKTPLDVKEDDRVTLDLSVILGFNGYEWTWQTQHHGRDQEGGPTSFKQSTFFNPRIELPEYYRRKNRDSRPNLSLTGRLTHRALTLMQSDHTNAEIAAILEQENSQLNRPANEWMDLVIKLFEKYSD